MARQRDLTVIVVRGTTERTLNFSLPRFLLPAFVTMFTIMVAVAAISIHSWSQAKQSNQTLHQEITSKDQTIGQQEAAMRDLADKTRQAEPLLQQLEKMHKQLQDLLKANQDNLSQGSKSTSSVPTATDTAEQGTSQGGSSATLTGAAAYGVLVQVLPPEVRDYVLGRASSRAVATASRSASAFSRQRDNALELAKVTVSRLDQQIQQAGQLQSLLAGDQKQVENRISFLAHSPSGSPVSGYTVSSEFGWRQSPFGSGADFHPGIDLACDYGTPVYATGDGEVEVASYYTAWYGVTVMIDHGYGFETLYAHNQWRLEVKPGDRVKRGQLLGYVGMTGDTTGPHVHYEVRLDGQKVNPRSYLD